MSDKPLFEGMDEKERELAPQQVPGEQQERVVADEGGAAVSSGDERPSAAPVASTGTSPSAISAPAGIDRDNDRAADRDNDKFFGEYPIDDRGERRDRDIDTTERG